MTTKSLFTINSLWIGETLPLIERICALSMLAQGHHVRIFTYKDLTDIPAGIEIADANDIIPEAEILTYARAGFRNRQMASNIFRYRMMRHNAGLWLDLDMLLLKPIPAASEAIFGLEGDQLLNTAVLYLPAHDKILEKLLEFTVTPYPIPPFFTTRMRFGLRRRKWFNRPVHVADMPWGVFGPTALTYFAKIQNRMISAAPISVFYPIYLDEAHGPLTAGWDVAARLTPKTIGIHLWSHNLREPSALRPFGNNNNVIEPGSFLADYAARELGLNLKE